MEKLVAFGGTCGELWEFTFNGPLIFNKAE